MRTIEIEWENEEGWVEWRNGVRGGDREKRHSNFGSLDARRGFWSGMTRRNDDAAMARFFFRFQLALNANRIYPVERRPTTFDNELRLEKCPTRGCGIVLFLSTTFHSNTPARVNFSFVLEYDLISFRIRRHGKNWTIKRYLVVIQFSIGILSISLSANVDRELRNVMYRWTYELVRLYLIYGIFDKIIILVNDVRAVHFTGK